MAKSVMRTPAPATHQRTARERTQQGRVDSHGVPSRSHVLERVRMPKPAIQPSGVPRMLAKTRAVAMLSQRWSQKRRREQRARRVSAASARRVLMG